MSERLDYEDILLADDDVDDAYFFSMALNDVLITAKLRHAEDGEKLFEELKKKIPDLLFLDIHMPCKDGVECIREIRKNRLYDRMPVIMFTSISRRAIIEDTYREGANFFIEKQNSIAELTLKLTRILSLDWKNNMIYPSLDQYLL